ncbi:MAG: hypothetical protein GVY15_02150 [Bacteroidetes bacterium]|jgi:predicted 3-demethylubiquinone-9 3-methyltransferase (glyoxalase superfamily)|nr:hypothetical protein [Bacteroidota bacterium]
MRSLITYTGTPTSAEQQRLHAGFDDLERRYGLGAKTPAIGSPWIVIMRKLKSRETIWIANRFGIPITITARSLDMLMRRVKKVVATHEVQPATENPSGGSNPPQPSGTPTV